MRSILADKDKLKEAIEKTDSCSEALVYLGLRNAGGNFNTLRKYAALYGLRLKDTNEVRAKTLKVNSKAKLEDILVENSKYKGSKLRTRLVEEGYLRNQCSECGIGPEWNNKPLSLQLDHINGIHRDNRLENLRIVCPNCHTQTETFGSKNKRFSDKRTKSCTGCGGFVSSQSRSGKCRTCVDQDKRKGRPNRETLLKDVEQMGYRGTGRKYSVSDTTIKKWLQ